jgi:hypothetical protein
MRLVCWVVTESRLNINFRCFGVLVRLIGYKTRRCNGRYTEEEAQQIVDPYTGLFLCQECFLNYENDPVMSQKKEEYTLQLVDNAKDLKLAVDNIRRVNVQLSGKMVGSQQLRAGVYDLLQKVRGKGKDPITSNLPSESEYVLW